MPDDETEDEEGKGEEGEETGDEVVLMKNKSGRVIGFEKLNFSVSKPEKFQVAFETVAA